MILAPLANLDRYAILHPLFAQAFQRLRELARRPELPAGRVELDGEALYAVVVEGAGRLLAEAKLETHRAYIDLQFTAIGCDRIGWSPLAAVTGSEGYDAAKDLEFYTATPQAWFEVPAGQVAIFFPDDAHAPMANCGQPTRKIVVKVAV